MASQESRSKQGWLWMQDLYWWEVEERDLQEAEGENLHGNDRSSTGGSKALKKQVLGDDWLPQLLFKPYRFNFETYRTR